MEDTVKIEELSSVERKISITIPPEEVDKKFDDFFKSIKKDAQIRGFRKGKVPIKLLKHYFGDKAKDTVSQMLMSEYVDQAIKDNDINPINISGAEESAGKFGDDNSYSVDMVVEVLPTIDPVGYTELELEMPTHDTGSMFKQKMLEYREQFAERNQVTERGAQLGDALVVDFKGFIDGEAFEGGEAQGHSIDKLGKANFIPGFEDQLVGVKAGESKAIDVKFPEAYRAKHLAGKDAKFDVTVHSIVETKLAKVDDDLAMMIGYETINELNEHVQKEVDERSANLNKQILGDQITSKILEANEFEVPPSMVSQEVKRLNTRFGNNQIQEDIVTGMAERNVKRAILLDAIYEKENDIEVTPEELDELLEQHATQQGKTKDEIVSILYNTGQMDALLGTLRSQRVIDFIIDHAKKESEEDDGREDTEEASSDGVQGTDVPEQEG
jgi:trigger factor